MGWALRFNGDTSVAVMASDMSLAIGDTLTIKAQAAAGNSGGEYRLMGRGDVFSNLISMRATSVLVRFQDNFGGFTLATNYTQPPIGATFILALHRVDATNYEMFLDTQSIGSFNTSQEFTPHSIGSFGSGYTKAFSGHIEYITNGTINNWDATASNHLAGIPILTDTISGNSATSAGMTSNGNAWINLALILVTPTRLRLTQSGVVNLDFMVSDNTSRLTQGGVITNGKAYGGTLPEPTTFKPFWARNIINNQLIGA